jgi:hypothetical protein
MHDEVQHMPLVSLGEQYHALDPTLLVFSTFSCVSHGHDWFVKL